MKPSANKLSSTKTASQLFMRSAGSIDVAEAGESPRFMHINDFKDTSNNQRSHNYHHHSEDNTSDEEEDFFVTAPAASTSTAAAASAATTTRHSNSSVLNAILTPKPNENKHDRVEDLIQKLAKASFKPKVVNVVELDGSNQQNSLQNNNQRNNINIIQHAQKVFICKDGIYVHEKCPKNEMMTSDGYYDERTNTRITFVPVVKEEPPQPPPLAKSNGKAAMNIGDNSKANSIYHHEYDNEEEREEESVIRPVSYANVYEQHYFPFEYNSNIKNNTDNDDERTIINRYF